MLLDILIPTYNRCEYLIKNIVRLEKIILAGNLSKKVRILVSNNGSDDGSREYLESLVTNVDIQVFHQPHNIGPLENTEFVLSMATAMYCMFLGDDDFLHERYLDQVVRVLEADTGVGFVVSSYYPVDPSGERIGHSGRYIDVPSKMYPPGKKTVRSLSWLAHQMSGLVFKRTACFTSYFDMNLRSMYPFIYFASMNCMEEKALLLTDFPVEVTQLPQAMKDWGYGDDGLILDKFKCYHAAFNSDTWFRCSLEIRQILRQKALLVYFYNGFSSYYRLFQCLFRSAYLTKQTKLLLLPLAFVLPIIGFPSLLRLILRR